MEVKKLSRTLRFIKLLNNVVRVVEFRFASLLLTSKNKVLKIDFSMRQECARSHSITSDVQDVIVTIREYRTVPYAQKYICVFIFYMSKGPYPLGELWCGFR